MAGNLVALIVLQGPTSVEALRTEDVNAVTSNENLFGSSSSYPVQAPNAKQYGMNIPVKRFSSMTDQDLRTYISGQESSQDRTMGCEVGCGVFPFSTLFNGPQAKPRSISASPFELEGGFQGKVKTLLGRHLESSPVVTWEATTCPILAHEDQRENMVKYCVFFDYFGDGEENHFALLEEVANTLAEMKREIPPQKYEDNILSPRSPFFREVFSQRIVKKLLKCPTTVHFLVVNNFIDLLGLNHLKKKYVETEYSTISVNADILMKHFDKLVNAGRIGNINSRSQIIKTVHHDLVNVCFRIDINARKRNDYEKFMAQIKGNQNPFVLRLLAGQGLLTNEEIHILFGNHVTRLDLCMAFEATQLYKRNKNWANTFKDDQRQRGVNLDFADCAKHRVLTLGSFMRHQEENGHIEIRPRKEEKFEKNSDLDDVDRDESISTREESVVNFKRLESTMSSITSIASRSTTMLSRSSSSSPTQRMPTPEWKILYLKSLLHLTPKECVNNVQSVEVCQTAENKFKLTFVTFANNSATSQEYPTTEVVVDDDSFSMTGLFVDPRLNSEYSNYKKEKPIWRDTYYQLLHENAAKWAVQSMNAHERGLAHEVQLRLEGLDNWASNYFDQEGSLLDIGKYLPSCLPVIMLLSHIERDHARNPRSRKGFNRLYHAKPHKKGKPIFKHELLSMIIEFVIPLTHATMQQDGNIVMNILNPPDATPEWRRSRRQSLNQSARFSAMFKDGLARMAAMSLDLD